jgi:hypothetical protein
MLRSLSDHITQLHTKNTSPSYHWTVCPKVAGLHCPLKPESRSVCQDISLGCVLMRNTAQVTQGGPGTNVPTFHLSQPSHGTSHMHQTRKTWQRVSVEHHAKCRRQLSHSEEADISDIELPCIDIFLRGNITLTHVDAHARQEAQRFV